MLNEIKDFVLRKQELNCNKIGSKFPHSTDNGIYDRSDKCSWVGGFYVGINYLCYQMGGSKIFLDVNDKLIDKLEATLDEKGKALGHDIGMLFSPSSYAKFVIFNDERAKKLTIKAGDALCERYKECGGYIQAWDVWGESESAKENEYRIIIDCMYNLPLLFRCYELTGNKKYYDIAYSHAKIAQKYLVRADFTTPHTFVFNPDGTPKYEKTHQGYADDSYWARGQGWAISGFAMAYRFTDDKSFLDTSIALAKKLFELNEENYIPRWDMVFKGRRNVPRDTSAASIIANGLMEIYDATGIDEYKEYAYNILVELYKNYSTRYEDKTEGMITEATGHMPCGINVNVSLIYGDYYFVELLCRMLGVCKGYW